MRRNVVMLNNIGVALIEKHCYGQAIDTLKDAVSILRSMSHFVGAAIATATHDVVFVIAEDRLDRYLLDANIMQKSAMRRISNPLTAEKAAIFLSLHVSDSNQNSLDTVMSRRSFSLTPIFHLLRMDGLLDDKSMLNVNNLEKSSHDNGSSVSREQAISTHLLVVPDLESSIVLYNTGLAIFCMSLTHPTRNIHYQSSAIQMLQLAQTLYLKALQKALSSRTIMNQPQSISVCRLDLSSGWTVILNTLVTSLLLSSLHEKALYYQTLLSHAEALVIVWNDAKQRYGLLPHNASAA
jgi:hypothetical protein